MATWKMPKVKSIALRLCAFVFVCVSVCVCLIFWIQPTYQTEKITIEECPKKENNVTGA